MTDSPTYADMTPDHLRLVLYINSLSCSDNPWTAYHAAFAAYNWIVTGRHEAEDDLDDLDEMTIKGSA